MRRGDITINRVRNRPPLGPLAEDIKVGNEFDSLSLLKKGNVEPIAVTFLHPSLFLPSEDSLCTIVSMKRNEDISLELHDHCLQAPKLAPTTNSKILQIQTNSKLLGYSLFIVTFCAVVAIVCSCILGNSNDLMRVTLIRYRLESWNVFLDTNLVCSNFVKVQDSHSVSPVSSGLRIYMLVCIFVAFIIGTQIDLSILAIRFLDVRYNSLVLLMSIVIIPWFWWIMAIPLTSYNFIAYNSAVTHSHDLASSAFQNIVASVVSLGNMPMCIPLTVSFCYLVTKGDVDAMHSSLITGVLCNFMRSLVVSLYSTTVLHAASPRQAIAAALGLTNLFLQPYSSLLCSPDPTSTVTSLLLLVVLPASFGFVCKQSKHLHQLLNHIPEFVHYGHSRLNKIGLLDRYHYRQSMLLPGRASTDIAVVDLEDVANPLHSSTMTVTSDTGRATYSSLVSQVGENAEDTFSPMTRFTSILDESEPTTVVVVTEQVITKRNRNRFHSTIIHWIYGRINSMRSDIIAEFQMSSSGGGLLLLLLLLLSIITLIAGNTEVYQISFVGISSGMIVLVLMIISVMHTSAFILCWQLFSVPWISYSLQLTAVAVSTSAFSAIVPAIRIGAAIALSGIEDIYSIVPITTESSLQTPVWDRVAARVSQGVLPMLLSLPVQQLLFLSVASVIRFYGTSKRPNI